MGARDALQEEAGIELVSICPHVTRGSFPWTFT